MLVIKLYSSMPMHRYEMFMLKREYEGESEGIRCVHWVPFNIKYKTMSS